MSFLRIGLMLLSLLAFTLTSFGQASVSLSGGLTDYRIDTGLREYLTGTPNGAEYGMYFDGSMNPYRSGYSPAVIKAFVPMSENYKYNIPDLNNPYYWTVDINYPVGSPRNPTFSAFDNRYWIFSTYCYDPYGYFVLGFCHAENYAATQISPYPSPTRTLQRNGVGIPGFPTENANPNIWSSYKHIFAPGFNLIYSLDGGASFSRGGTVSTRSILVPANPPAAGTVQPWYGFFHPSNPVYEAPYIYIFVQHVSQATSNWVWQGAGYTWDVSYAGPVLLRINATNFLSSSGGFNPNYHRGMWQHFRSGAGDYWENINTNVAQDASVIAGTQRIYPLFYSSGPIIGSGLAKQGYIQNIRRVGNTWVTLGTDDTAGAGRMVWRGTSNLGTYAEYLRWMGGYVNTNGINSTNFYLGQQKYISFFDYNSTDRNFQTIPNNSSSSYVVVANGTAGNPYCSGWRRVAVTFSGF